MFYRRVTAPIPSPVSLEEARAHLRLEPGDTGQDAEVEAAIAGAVDHLDGRTGLLGRPMVTQTWEVLAAGPCGGEFVIELGSVQSIDKVERRASGAWVEVPADIYATFPRPGGRTAVVARLGWPGSDPDEIAWRITLTAGYGAADAVPAALKAAVKILATDLFENRDAKTLANLVENPTVTRLISPHRLLGV